MYSHGIVYDVLVLSLLPALQFGPSVNNQEIPRDSKIEDDII